MLCHKGPTFTMSPFTMFSRTIKGLSINIVTALLEWGQGFSDDITKALLIKKLDNGESDSKTVIKCVTSFMDES